MCTISIVFVRLRQCTRRYCRELCKSGWTDRFAVWVVDSIGPKEAQVQPYTPGGANVPRFGGHIGATGEYVRLRRRCGPMSNYFDQLLLLLHCVSKNVPPLTCYNLDIHSPIAIIFGRGVTEKVRNETMLCFFTSPVYCFSITLGRRKPIRQRIGALCVQQSPTTATLSTSFLLNHAPTAPSWTHWLQDLESHTAAWLWVVSQKDWRNQAVTCWILAMHQYSEWKTQFSCFPFFQVVQKHMLGLFQVA